MSLLPFLLYVRCSPTPCLYVILPYISHDRSNWSSPSFSSTTFQNFFSLSALLSGVSKFQHHTMPCSKSNSSLVSRLNLSPICWWKVFFLLNASISKVHSRRNLGLVKFRDCFLLQDSQSLVFTSDISQDRDQNTGRCNFTCCFVWPWNSVSFSLKKHKPGKILVVQNGKSIFDTFFTLLSTSSVRLSVRTPWHLLLSVRLLN
jgi:hypothetical protein